MITTELSKIGDIIQNQREFFETGKTKDVTFRIEQLKNLKQAIIEHEQAIVEALKADLHKPELEIYITEIGVIKEIDYAIKHINTWTKPKKAPVSFDFFSYSAKIYPEPLGVVLIIRPLELSISVNYLTVSRCDRSRELCNYQAFRNCFSYLWCHC